MRHWISGKQERQAQLIRRWKPQDKSTGSKAKKGKRRSALNTLKRGMRFAAWLVEMKRLERFFQRAETSRTDFWPKAIESQRALFRRRSKVRSYDMPKDS
jgi:hypothetical protein